MHIVDITPRIERADMFLYGKPLKRPNPDKPQSDRALKLFIFADGHATPDLDSDFSMVEEFANRHGPREKPFWRVTGYIDTQQNSVPIWVTTHTETLPEHTLLPPTNQIKD